MSTKKTTLHQTRRDLAGTAAVQADGKKRTVKPRGRRRVALAVATVTAATVLSACSTGSSGSAAGAPDAAADLPLPATDAYNITNSPSHKDIDLAIESRSMRVGGKEIKRYVYTDAARPETAALGAGLPIVVDAGDTVRLDVANGTGTATNIHWHGMSVPNEQDGPGLLIEPGTDHTYSFKAEAAGTYWYHSHERPVRDQVDEGMYAPFIVRDPADAEYDLDQILVLDDWVAGGNVGHMEVVGDVDTVNGRTGKDISPLALATGQIAKLRLINASSARTQVMRFPVGVRVTHTDGAPLPEPYTTRSLEIAPGERYDVELAMTDSTDKNLAITNERDAGLRIPITYTASGAKPAASPFTPPPTTSLAPGLNARNPDVEMTLSDDMAGMSGHRWTINGEVFPETGRFDLERGRTYRIRFRNDGMHRMGHPMHLHGAHFRVLDHDGTPEDREIWKDTIDIPYGQYVDVAVTFDKPGAWMVHCHILDHEDGGMMTTVDVR
ncbi:multicopper oxidase family protein [Streptomyces sp. TRM66268-LWL]|uniref:Multicopper oxidase family protein n=1 Tax=Streptomyces polyasparticus TaxID=2767826 RepID=A0ABR7STP2_9ACTN|nr:multicopper oxidase family protein [Streptomyces polyasparticus]MBC9718788.1 multicopper oxidase family protein [Streptomyces polyasparticus]